MSKLMNKLYESDESWVILPEDPTESVQLLSGVDFREHSISFHSAQWYSTGSYYGGMIHEDCVTDQEER